MVGIVIVSHSRLLAEGVRELALQMSQEPVPVAVAAGIDATDGFIGTDPLAVQEAIEMVYSDDGVVVLMDLGSAVMSAEMALEFLPAEQRQNVHLCAAPLVEGAIAAVVQAATGSDVAQVLAEARGALQAKQVVLGEEAQTVFLPDASPTMADGPTQTLTLTVPNRLGLHARPAARLVGTANRFQADVTISKGERQANAKSINQVATLGVRQGDVITIMAVGPDAAALLTAVKTLADDNFGDRDDTELSPETGVESTAPQLPEIKDGILIGIGVSAGVAVAPVYRYRFALPDVEQHEIEDVGAEQERLETAVTAAAVEIQQLQQEANRRVGPDEAAIFDAHLLILQDPDLQAAAQEQISQQQVNAEFAWQSAIEQVAADYLELEDDYMRNRAADVLDVGKRVLHQLMDLEAPSLDFDKPVILVAADLNPSDTARLNPKHVQGICTERGGATSHSAILARALGIPAIVGLGHELGVLEPGQVVGLDGSSGQLWLKPDKTQQKVLEKQRARWLDQQALAKAAGQGEAVTPDNHRVEVAANVGGPHDVAVALEYGAEGVGLFRTEFLFMERGQAPDEEEQLAAYREVLAGLNGRSVIVRTLDVGGDKPLPYIDLGSEENPFLGWRGIRFCLGNPDLFKTQLRAICRASINEAGEAQPVKLMFPMIGTLAELQEAKALLAEAQAELEEAEQLFVADMEVGIMIEVPSAVAIADQLAVEADFFSIGTNDLTQYLMAADRGNAQVSHLADALQPAVLRQIKQVVEAGHAAGIWVGLCGELAGNELATPLLVGLELDELSMNAPAIPAVKQAIRQLTLSEARQLADEVLKLESVTAVTDYLKDHHKTSST
jgi:multiphosphoryl transfer protein